MSVKYHIIRRQRAESKAVKEKMKSKIKSGIYRFHKITLVTALILLIPLLTKLLPQ